MEPQRKIDHGIDPDIRPDFRSVPNGNESTPSQPPRDVSNELAASEGKGTADTKQPNSISEGEANGGHTFANNFSGKGQKSNVVNAKNLWLRRGGIIGGSGGLIGILLFLFTGFFGGAGVLLNLGETTTANLDNQSSFLNRRMYAVLDNKIGGDMTKGDCNVTKIACRYSRPSNALLKRLDANGIKALNAAGDPIDVKKGPWPNEKPTSYTFTDKAGNVQSINARDFTKTLRNNPEFRNLFTKAFNARYWSYADSFVRKALKKVIGSEDRTGDKAKKIDPNDPQKTIAAVASDAGKDNTVLKAGDADGRKTAASEMLTKEVSAEVEKSARKGLKTGDPILAAGTIACMGINAPGVITKIVRLYQIRQEVALASTLVLSTYGMLKAGDMSPETMASIGTILTSTKLLPDGTKTKSFMDADGIKNILFNGNASSDSFKKFVPGYAAIQSTKGISAFANDKTTKATCNAIYSPYAMLATAAISAVVGSATLGIGAAVLEGLKAAGKAAAAIGATDLIMDKANELGLISGVVGAIVGAIPPEAIADLLGNKDLESASGEDLGNATAFGIEFTHQLAFESTGGAPATLTQMAAYNESNKEYLVAYAEQDRVGRSAFDVSSPYTFLGSIVSDYYSTAYKQGDIVNTVLSSVGYAITQPLKLFSNKTFADEAALAEKYSHAEEFGVDSQYAIDGAGSAYTAVPTEFQGVDSLQVLGSVDDQIDTNTGEANKGSEIENRLSTCTTADLLAVEGCAIKEQKDANIALYITDKRVNDMFDGTNPDSAEAGSGAAGGTAAGDTFNEEDLFKDSTQTACAPGTDEAGNDTGYHGGPENSFPVRLCAIPGTDEGGKPIRVSSIVSGAVLKMINAMKIGTGDSVIKAADSFRTKEGQEHAYRCYTGNRNPGEDCSDIAGKAAPPGMSMHQSGNAIDFQLPSGNRGSSRPGDRYWEWLRAHAGEFGYKQYAGESWHWSATGQ